MDQLLPRTVLEKIGRQFEIGVAQAAEAYSDLSADEDAVTGGLAQALRTNVRGRMAADGVQYKWLTRLRKLRGRGNTAPEKTWGMDAILQFEVKKSGLVVGHKTLPIQAKNNWSRKDSHIMDQAQKINEIPGGGLIVDYRPTGYQAVSSDVVLRAGGSPKNVPDGTFRNFGQYLSSDFLSCKIGSREVYYDETRQLIVLMSNGQLIPLPADWRIRTVVNSSDNWHD